MENNQIKKVIYTAKVHTTGGRDGGASRSSDDRLDIKFSVPGTTESGTNPEQLFAAGWSACFLSGINISAKRMKVKIPDNISIDIEIDLCLTGEAYSFQARFHINMPGVEHDAAQLLADAAHQLCPYSKATRGNIDVEINVV